MWHPEREQPFDQSDLRFFKRDTSMTKALILAAGQGTRLRPLTDDKPKCLVTLCGSTLLERQVNNIRACGIDDIRVVTGYYSEAIERKGFSTFYNSKYRSTNMLYSLFCASSFLSSSKEDILVSYADIIVEPSNIKKLMETTGSVVCMIDKEWLRLWSLRNENPLEDAETLVLQNDNRILEIGRTPIDYTRIHGQYTGLIKLTVDGIREITNFFNQIKSSTSATGMINSRVENMHMTEFLQLYIESGGEVVGSCIYGGWLEVDSVADLEIYERLEKMVSSRNFLDCRDRKNCYFVSFFATCFCNHLVK